jgi:acetyl esterase/lipase
MADAVAIAAAVTRLFMRIPERARRRLVGVPIRADGLELAPDVQMALALLRFARHRGLDTMTPPAARAELLRSARLFAGALEPVARVDEKSVPGPEGPLRARLYVPASDDRRRGLVVYFHGGGWVVGDLDTHDSTCRFLARAADVLVLAVDYRLAPEHPFPAAVDDALAAFAWAAREAGALGADPARVAVAGDSAGGNLAAVVAGQARPRPCAQLLVYPVTDVSTKHPSYRTFADGYFLTEREMDWYRDHYLSERAAAGDPRVSPLLAGDLSGLPPAIVATAGFDVLRDEGEAYARRLEEAGVPVSARRYGGLVHGFANATGASTAARAAMSEAARLLADVLARAG